MPNRLCRIALVAGLGFCFASTFGCGSSQSVSKADAAYIAGIQQWHKKRIEALIGPNGWVNLAGLFWLKEGENRFGAHTSNDLVFPAGKAPEFIGSFILKDDTVSVNINPGIEVLHQGNPVKTAVLKSDVEDEPTVLDWGSLSWFIIKRGDAFGVRLRDNDSPLLREFKGIETFPIDPAWRLEARLETYDPPKLIPIPTVLGTVDEQSSPGALVFQIQGATYRLDALGEPDAKQLFVIFADQTNGIETYGAGRFLYVEKPRENAAAWIDFNKAYNPPCAFSEFATCPLPPGQNHLPLRVTAGEMNYGDANH